MRNPTTRNSQPNNPQLTTQQIFPTFDYSSFIHQYHYKNAQSITIKKTQPSVDNRTIHPAHSPIPTPSIRHLSPTFQKHHRLRSRTARQCHHT